MRKRNSGFVVQALDHATVVLAFGVEVLEQKFLVSTQHAGDLLHLFEARSYGAGGPCPQIGRSPGRAAVEPEAPKAFLEFPGARRGPQRGKYRVEFGPSVVPRTLVERFNSRKRRPLARMRSSLVRNEIPKRRSAY